MKPSYRKAVAWIASNEDEELLEESFEVIALLISVMLVADLFGKTALKVAVDVNKYRMLNGLNR